jgi:N-acetylglucosamine-6-phosphate deacetylase
MAVMHTNGSPPNSLLLKNANAILPKPVSENFSILIEEGLIKALVNSPIAESFARENSNVDLKGLTLYPGFIDVHIHGALGVDTMNATADDLIRVSRFLATQGVTGWMPTLVPAPIEDYQRAVSAIAQAITAQEGAGILGVHYEGPFVNPTQCGALRSNFFRKFSGPGDIDDLPLLTTPGARHMMTFAPEIEGGIELARELSSRGWIVSIGHTRADFAVLDEALRAGAAHMTHFMNAMSPLHHRSPGPVGWGLLRDEVTCDVIADGVHLDLQTLQLLIKTKGVDRLSLISDAIAATGLGDGKYHIWNEEIVVKDGRTQNSRGSIAGSVISMLDAVALVKSLGVSPFETSRMASLNPARLLGIESGYGSIEEGKRADLVAFDADGKVRLTVIGGEVVHDRQA